MADISPAAQAVLDAVVFSKPGLYSGIAAALRAAAVAVETDDGVSREVRLALNKLLAIAAELEGEIK